MSNIEMGSYDPFAKLPALAARLGVAPLDQESTHGRWLIRGGGHYYDCFDLINAALDRLDGISHDADR